MGLKSFKDINQPKLENAIAELKSIYDPEEEYFIDKKQKERYIKVFNDLSEQ